MKNKFRYQYSTAFKIVFALFFICWVAILAINVFKVANLFNFYSHDLIAEITCIVFALLSFVVWFWLVTLKYVVTDKIALKFGFWDLTKGKFKVDKTIKIVHATNEDKLYLNVYVNDAPHIALINVNPKDFDSFASCVRDKNRHVLFDKAEIEK